MNGSVRVRGRMSRTVVALVVVALALAWLPATQFTGVAHADNSNTVLVLQPTTVGSNLEVSAIQALGLTAQSVSKATWDGMTTAQFASYRALVIGDPSCTTADNGQVSNSATWTKAATGNVIIIGTDPVFHSGGSKSSKQYTLISQGIKFAADNTSGTGTGAYVDQSCGVSVGALSGFGSFSAAGASVCYNLTYIVASHPALNGLSDGDLANWGCSVHQTYASWPASFSVLALATGGTNNYTGIDKGSGTSVSGAPYILARGAGLVVLSSINISPLTASVGAGTSVSYTSNITENSTPVANKTVTFTETAGPNTGTVLGTATTDSTGNALFSFTPTVGGTYSIQASYTNSLSRTVTSSNASLTVTADTTPPTTTASLSNSLYVDARNGFNDSGINLAAGQSIVLTATGTASCGGGPTTCLSGPNGDGTTGASNWLAPGAIGHGLVGKVGSGAGFTVGSGPTTVTGPGELYLGYNDDYYGDNNGGYTVTLGGAPAAHNGWYSAPVHVTLASSDPDDLVAATHYKVDGAAAYSTYSAPIWVNGDGTHTVSYYSVDSHGNTETAKTSTIKIDGTNPTITGAISGGTVGSNGWYTSPVTVHFSCADATSGVAACSPDTTLTGDGGGQSVTGSATDNAGNTNSATVSGINIDTTAPTLSGTPTTSPNGNGWYNGPVTIAWNAADASGGSGLDPATVPGNTVLSGEGAGQTAHASVSDLAGNTTSANSAPVVNIDTTKPITTISSIPTWSNTDTTVTLSPTDNLSGVAATYYTVNGGPQQTGTSITFSAEGVYNLTYWSVDNAGNAETPKSATVQIDKTAPTLSHTLSPAPNGAGWNNADVTVTFTCIDPISGGVSSGIATCTVPQTVTTEGTAQQVTGTGTDNAGNTGTDVATVNLDKTAPLISGAPDRAPNSNGWYNAPVTVNFGCTDDRSGMASCGPDQTLLTDGANQSVTGTAVDAAGNSSTATVGGINIDQTPPTVSASSGSYTPGAGSWSRVPVTVTFVCTDGGSGVATTSAPVTLASDGAGQHVTGTCTDLAGNSASVTLTDINIDQTPPTIAGSATGAPANAAGWYNRSVTVSFTCGDLTSGVASCPADTILGQGKNQSVSGTATDVAGNTASASVSGINIDLTPPTITATATKADGTPYASGTWTNQKVTVSYTCGDDLSGVASCPVAQTFGEGDNQTATGTAKDVAGNSASATFSNIKVDLTKPTISITGADNNGLYNGSTTPIITPADNLSGIASTTATLDGQPFTSGTTVSALGPHTLSVTTTDRAGNSTSATTTFMVYAFPGGGTFTLGDGTVAGAAPGATLYFWGSQWAKNNVLSGGSAPNQFKGFLTSPSQPTCGQTFMADPGNSGTPPVSVPSYMAVVVSSAISNSGSQITGTVKKVVVVKTNSGYANSPGNPGTGTIVATICG